MGSADSDKIPEIVRRTAFTLFFLSLLAVLDTGLVVAQRSENKPKPFDTFGQISADDASARFDNFAIQLQENPALVGYVVAYGPEGKWPGTGDYVARLAKAYLVESRGIDADQVRTINPGRYKDPGEMFVELWLVSLGSPAPEPRRYTSRLKRVIGKFADDGSVESPDGCGCGPEFGNVTRASFGDSLRQQKEDIGYIVAFNYRGAITGNWRRVAKRIAAELQDDAVEADRIKIIYGGSKKPGENDFSRRCN